MAKMTCKNCGEPLDPNYSFCLNCGAKVEVQPAPVPVLQDDQQVGLKAKAVQPGQPNEDGYPLKSDGFCRECGSKVRAGWIYCMQCGVVLVPIQASWGEGMAVMPGDSSTAAVPEFSESPVDDSGDSGSAASMDLGLGQDIGGVASLGEDAGYERDSIADYDDELTSVYDDDSDDVTMVYDEEQVSYVLTRTSSGERYELKLPTTVGRGSKAETRISGNPYIGRIHAEVYEQGGDVYIVDKHSANHTYVNGEMLDSEVPTKIMSGDTVALAKDEFTFEVDYK